MVADKLLLLGTVITVGGAAAIAFGYFARRSDLARKEWPTTPATIISAQIVRTTQARLRHPTRDRLPTSEPTYKEVPVWALDVEYSYVSRVGERRGYTATSSHQFAEIRNGESDPPEPLRRALAGVSPGSTMPLHVDPADERNTYLLYFDSEGSARLLKMGAVLLAIGIAIAAGSRFAPR